MPTLAVKEGKAISFTPGKSLLQLLTDGNGPLESTCGGRGICGKCKVRHTGGILPPVSAGEAKFLTAMELESGLRLACFVYPDADADISLPKRVEADILLGDAPVANTAASGPCSGDKRFGIAVDIGTTTVAASLVRLPDGSVLVHKAAINPQMVYGLDILSRISYSIEHPGTGLFRLQSAIVGCLNELLESLCAAADCDMENIREIVVCANSTMLHLLLGIAPDAIGRAPYRPVFIVAQERAAAEIGLFAAPDCRLYCAPSVSGFIGADIVAGIYAVHLAKKEGHTLFLDIGTNGEMVLASGGRLMACACAAGPALEGMSISCGARALVGAIENMEICAGEVICHTIGGTAPIGLCGSGILAAVRELLRHGLLRRDGRLEKPKTLPANDTRRGLLFTEGKTAGVLLSASPRITVTQKDIRQVQLAKGAILSGVKALLDQAGLKAAALDEVLIAGQFGAHLDVDCLVDTGFLPCETKEKIRYVGNTSHTGALLALTHTDARRGMAVLARKIEYFELSVLENYEKLFRECLMFEKPKPKEMTPC